MNKVLCSNSLRTLRLFNASLLSRASVLNRSEACCLKKTSNAPTLPLADAVNIRRYATASTGENAQPIEKADKKVERYDFMAETKQLLNIVAKSLYSEKEVFIRELISNSSDAIEKLKYTQLSETKLAADEMNQLPFEIKIDANDINNTLTIQVLMHLYSKNKHCSIYLFISL